MLYLTTTLYLVHSSIPFFHSWYSPKIKIVIIIILEIIHSFILIIFVEYIGIIIEISMSKIKNIIAIIKKWVENGVRADENDENPHSNGEFFSRLIFAFFDRVDVINNIIIKIITKIIAVNVIFIISLKFYPLSWKLIILYILKKLFSSSV